MLVGSYGEGLNEVASRFHGYIRRVHRDWLVDHGIAPKPRPVILNTWEAVYFNHDYDTLTALADKAVESGVERFVVDDAGSVPAETTPPASATGRFRRTLADGDKSLKRSPTTCTARASNSACGSSRKWSTPIPTCSATIRTGC